MTSQMSHWVILYDSFDSEFDKLSNDVYKGMFSKIFGFNQFLTVVNHAQPRLNFTRLISG